MSKALQIRPLIGLFRSAAAKVTRRRLNSGAGRARLTAGPAALSRTSFLLLRASKLILAAAVFAGAPGAASVSAQPKTAAQPPSNRWLLIVQTSSSMQRQAQAIEQIAGAMLASGMSGQMRRGDTVGLWTYDERLHAGQFPLQTWTPETSKEIARRVLEFLRIQKYEKGKRLDAFFPSMERVIKNSEFITVVLISDGSEEIHYTPFDDQINAVYSTWQKEQERANLPFVTVLRAQKGRMINFAVSVPPWSLELPPLPPELQTLKVAETKAVQQPAPIAQPLIISGKKSQPPPAAQPSEPLVSNALPVTMTATAEATTGGATPALAPPPPPAPAQSPAVAEENSKPVIPEPAKPVETATATAAPAQPAPQVAAAIIPSMTSNAPAPVPTAAATPPNVAPQASAPAQPTTAASPVQAMATVPQEESTSHGGNWIIAMGILALVVACVALRIAYVLVRRARSPVRISLVTHSLDRDKK